MSVPGKKRLPEPSPPLFQSLGRRKAYEEVAAEIRRLIFERRLQALHRLPTERQLAEQFGVGRTAVREAIRTLERSGLLQVKKGPKGGLFVARNYDQPINDSIVNLLAGGQASLEDLFEIRLLIEPYAAFRAAERASAGELAQLEKLLGEAEVVREEGAALRAHNIEFHRQILGMSGNPILSVIGEAVLRILSERIRTLVSLSTSESALEMHKAIFAALRKRQARKASSLMAADIEATGNRLAQLSPETLDRLARESSTGELIHLPRRKATTSR